MKLYYKHSFVLIISLFLITTVLNAQKVETPFDVNEVIKQVRCNHNFFDSREGEFLIDTSIAYCPKENGQGYSAVAFNGTNYLVVWEDEQSGSWDIYGTRVNPSGDVLDPTGIAISAGTFTERFPAVTSDGSNWLVVWRDIRNSSSYYDIYCARVSEAGIVLDPSGITICTMDNEQDNPAVSFDSMYYNYMVVWEDRRSGGSYEIYGARIDQSGVVLDPQGFRISSPGHYATMPSIAYGGDNFLITWGDGYNDIDIYGARVDRNGVVLDPLGIAICTVTSDQWIPAVTFGDESWLVVWLDTRNDLYRIYGARVDRGGVVQDTSGFCITPDSGYQTYPAVVFGGSNYFVIWSQDGHDIFGARVTLDGIVLDSSGIDISTTGYNEQIPSVAAGSINYLVTWTEERFQVDWDVYGGRVSQDGVVLDSADICLSRTVNRQHASTVAFGDSNYLIAWEDYRDDPYPDIFGARINQTGIILDSIGFPIATGTGSLRSPSVAYDGTNYLVVWSDDDIYGARISQNGTVLDTLAIQISTASGEQVAPSVVFDDTNYFVVWQDGWYGGIYGARVNQNGHVLDTLGIPISTAFGYQISPSVAFDGTNHLVVWQDDRNDNWDIYGARVNRDGIVLDPSGIGIATAAYYEESPAVAFDGTNYMIAWMYWPPPYDPDIYGTRVSQAGVVLDPTGFTICTASNIQMQPSIVFDGTIYFVLWQDKRSGAYYDIYGAEVSQWGYTISTFLVSNQSRNQISPALAHGQGEQLLMTYSGWADSINTHPANTMRIWGKFYPFVGIHENTGMKYHITNLKLQIYPNPVRKKCNVKYTLPKQTRVNISLFDVTGRLIKGIINEHQNAGFYHETFDMSNLAQGIYFIKLNTDNHLETKKIIFVK